VNPGQASGQALRDRVAHRLVEACLLWQRLGALDEPLRRIDEETRWARRGFLHDDAAGRILCGG
jgi:hypothetical protein